MLPKIARPLSKYCINTFSAGVMAIPRMATKTKAEQNIESRIGFSTAIYETRFWTKISTPRARPRDFLLLLRLCGRWLRQARGKQRRKARWRQCSGAAPRAPAIQSGSACRLVARRSRCHALAVGGATHGVGDPFIDRFSRVAAGWQGLSRSGRLRHCCSVRYGGIHGCDADPRGMRRSIAS